MAINTNNSNSLADVLTAMLAGSGYSEAEQDTYLKTFIALLENQEAEKQPGELSTFTDPVKLAEKFRNEEYGPYATGVPYIFTGGSPFPQTYGQQMGEKVATTGALINNVLPVVASVLDAWRKRKNTTTKPKAVTKVGELPGWE